MPLRIGARINEQGQVLGDGGRPLTDGLRLVDQDSQTIAKFTTGAVQPAADRAHGDIEDCADLLVTMAVEVFQNDDHAMLGTEAVERVLHDSFAFGTLQRGGRVGLGRLVGGMSSPGGQGPVVQAVRRTGSVACDGRSTPD